MSISRCFGHAGKVEQPKYLMLKHLPMVSTIAFCIRAVVYGHQRWWGMVMVSHDPSFTIHVRYIKHDQTAFVQVETHLRSI